MAGSVGDSWPLEYVPDTDDLYLRVHRAWLRDGSLGPGVFRNRQGGMSTDWSKYSTPRHTQERARTPSESGVIALRTGSVREIPQRVEHDPLQGNRAHTEVFGEKDPEVRLKLQRLARWMLPVPVGMTS